MPAFHGRIVDRAGNGTLRRVWGTLEPYSRTYINMAVRGADRQSWPSSTARSSPRSGGATPEAADEALRRHFERRGVEHRRALARRRPPEVIDLPQRPKGA